MAKKLSRYFGIPAATLKKAGVFNALIGIDNKLFVDPTLLRTAKTPEFRHARSHLENYFAKIIKLLELSKVRGDVAWKEAHRRLVFHEENATALGYGTAGAHGNAIGEELGARLLERGHQIVEMGVVDPVIFELVGFFEEGFGADRLSDMTVAITREAFVAYTNRITRELELIPRATVRDKGKDYWLPLAPDGRRHLLLLPMELLDALPVALDPSAIDDVKVFNEALRIKFNALFADAQKRKRHVTKSDIREVFFSTRDGIATLVRVYRETTGKPYNFGADPLALFEWEEVGFNFAKEYPLQLAKQAPRTLLEVKGIVVAIAKQFKKNIEENRLNDHLYDDEGHPRNEVFSQRLFYAIADAYCEANDVDLSREPNAGNGPVDFKITSGYRARVLVEIKLSSNTRLVNGFTEQLPAYEKSEGTEESIFLIIRVTESDASIKEVLRLRENAALAGKKVPDVYIIDARPTPSASKR